YPNPRRADMTRPDDEETARHPDRRLLAPAGLQVSPRARSRASAVIPGRAKCRPGPYTGVAAPSVLPERFSPWRTDSQRQFPVEAVLDIFNMLAVGALSCSGESGIRRCANFNQLAPASEAAERKSVGRLSKQLSPSLPEDENLSQAACVYSMIESNERRFRFAALYSSVYER